MTPLLSLAEGRGVTRIRVLHRKMELIVSMVSIQAIAHSTTETKKSKDQRKPFGCAITRFLFPSKEKPMKNIA